MDWMDRFRIEVLERVDGGEGPPRYVATGPASEIAADDPWSAARMLFESMGLISLPQPTYALRIRRISASAPAASA